MTAAVVCSCSKRQWMCCCGRMRRQCCTDLRRVPVPPGPRCPPLQTTCFSTGTGAMARCSLVAIAACTAALCCGVLVPLACRFPGRKDLEWECVACASIASLFVPPACWDEFCSTFASIVPCLACGGCVQVDVSVRPSIPPRGGQCAPRHTAPAQTALQRSSVLEARKSATRYPTPVPSHHVSPTGVSGPVPCTFCRKVEFRFEIYTPRIPCCGYRCCCC